VAVAVLISGFVALTLTPMLCSRMLAPLTGRRESWAERSFERFFTWLNDFYTASLRWPSATASSSCCPRSLMIAGTLTTYGSCRANWSRSRTAALPSAS